MYIGFQNDFPGGLNLVQFTDLFPDLNNGLATANLVFRVLDEDGSGQLGYKEFLQAIDLVGARYVRQSCQTVSLSLPAGLRTTSSGGPSRCTTRTTLGRWTSTRWRES